MNISKQFDKIGKGCKFCRSFDGINTIIDRVDEFDNLSLVYVKGNELFLEVSGDYYISEEINFCPMCGRILEKDSD